MWIIWDEIKPVGNQTSRNRCKVWAPEVLDTEDSSVRRARNLVICNLTQKLKKHKRNHSPESAISAMHVDSLPTTLTLCKTVVPEEGQEVGHFIGVLAQLEVNIERYR